ncbi:SLC13 family permease [Pedosphaera parvula]|uniref:Citrate transporter n=1 Tax=Pedosphaera parvula (strain Ellin514) TaxID=320771 RepID=B9XS89_PEDPL|nr:SLC13 family permease [Pedosphaera parvula]EEF57299.1 Citrate transporter [Pedosphaera parvula Ellin514]
MNDIAITFALVVVVVALFAWNRIPVVIVAIGLALALYATGILDAEQALGGLGDPAVIFIASLFVVSAGLDATGVTAWAGKFLIAKAGKSHTRLLIFIMLLVALLTALISVNGAVAALLPMVVVMAIKLGRSPSQLLMPLVFAAHAGSMLTLTGTPVNVLVSEAGTNAGIGAFGYFEFAIVGVPLLLGSMAIIAIFGERLLPQRRGRTIPSNLSKHAQTLIEQYTLDDGIFRLRVRPHSSYIGLSSDSIDFKDYPGLTLVSIQEGDEGGPLQRSTLECGDILIVRGEAKTACSLATDKILAFRSEHAAADVADALFNRTSGLGELVIPPRSGMIGTAVFPGMVTPSSDLVILAVQRKGEDLGPNETVLAAGDTLLLQGTWEALDEHLDDPDVLVVDSPEVVRRQAVPMGVGAKRAIAVLVGMVILLATDAVPAVIAGLVAACSMVLLKVLTVTQAYRSINWTTVILVGAMMPLSMAMEKTGAANLMAERLVNLVGNAGPYALLAGLFVLTALLGQIISNTATALIIIPIAVAAATEIGVSPRPVLMSVAVAAAASFLTPVATPVNLMVMGPGGYRFGDYWKLGLPLMLWFFVVATFLVPVFWRF